MDGTSHENGIGGVPCGHDSPRRGKCDGEKYRCNRKAGDGHDRDRLIDPHGIAEHEIGDERDGGWAKKRSEEHTSALQSLMCTAYAVICLKNKNKQTNNHY